VELGATSPNFKWHINVLAQAEAFLARAKFQWSVIKPIMLINDMSSPSNRQTTRGEMQQQCLNKETFLL